MPHTPKSTLDVARWRVWWKSRHRVFGAFCAVVGCLAGNAAWATTGTDIVAYARQYTGVKYRSGGTTPQGFDCSGYTWYVFDHFGITLPRVSADQPAAGNHVKAKHAKEGDLVFFKGSNAKSSKIGHVGIVVSAEGESPIRFIHASTSSGVREDDTENAYYKARFVSVVHPEGIDSRGKGKNSAEGVENQAVEEQQSDTEKSSVGRKRHTVGKGETLYKISKKYGVGVGDIQAWNGLETAILGVGQELWVSPPEGVNVAEAQTAEEVSVSPVEVEKNQAETPVQHMETSRTIVVKRGDTLYKISRETGVSVEAIKAANGLTGEALRVGQILHIGGETANVQVQQDAAKKTYHSVKRGETLYGIAKRYGTTVNALRQLNGLRSNALNVGQKLQVK